jgi:hypothetical protein
VFFVVLIALVGAAFYLIERIALRRTDLVGGLSQIVVFGTAALFVVESTEYNLRSVARFVYYAFFAVVVLAVILPRSQARDQRLKRWRESAAGTQHVREDLA